MRLTWARAGAGSGMFSGWEEGPSLGSCLLLAVPFDPLPTPISGKQTAYLAKEGFV